MASGPSVVEQLRHDLVGKTFTLASDVAGDTCLSIEGLGAPTSRLVDTEITEDAESRFYLRDTGFKFHICPYSAGTIGNANFSGASGMYIGRNLITNMHSSGSLVVVKLVDAKPDRIEIQLTPNATPSGENAYMKLKLMLGKGYESRSLEQIEMVLSRALVLPRITSIQSARAELEHLDESVNQLERKLASEKDAQARVDDATRLLAQYEERADTQERLSRVAFEPVSVDHSTSRIAALNTIIAEGKRQAAIDREQRASEEYASSTGAMTTSCERIDDSPAINRTELETTVANVDAAKSAIERFAEAQKQMEALGLGVRAEDKEIYASCFAKEVRERADLAEIQRLHDLEEITQQAEVASSPSEYSEPISGKLSKVEDAENVESPRTSVSTHSAASMLRTAALSLGLHSGMSQARVKKILVAHGYDGIHEMGQSYPWSHPWDCRSNNWANGQLVASCLSRKGGVQISIDFLLGKAHADPDTGELIGVRMDHLYHANFFYMVQSGDYRHFDLWEPNNGFVTKCDDCEFF
jgi:hypothetical protein